jgi:hypothetical protein
MWGRATKSREICHFVMEFVLLVPPSPIICSAPAEVSGLRAGQSMAAKPVWLEGVRPDALHISTDFVDPGYRVDFSWPLRGYVLLCAPSAGAPDRKVFYVGIAPRGKLVSRLASHVAGQACAFTTVYKPEKVCFAGPIPNPSAEFHLLALCLEVCPGSLVGGFTLTGPRPNPIDRSLRLNIERQVGGKCFRCGSSAHFARACPRVKFSEGISYRCDGCGTFTDISLDGRSTWKGPGEDDFPQANARPAASHSTILPATESVAPIGAPHVAAAKEVPPPRVRYGGAVAGAAVLFGGVRFQSLSWRLGREAYPAERTRAKERCLCGAIRLKGGSVKTLWKMGCVSAEDPKEVPFGGGFSYERVRRSKDPGSSKLSHVLMEASLLEQVFPKVSE